MRVEKIPKIKLKRETKLLKSVNEFLIEQEIGTKARSCEEIEGWKEINAKLIRYAKIGDWKKYREFYEKQAVGIKVKMVALEIVKEYLIYMQKCLEPKGKLFLDVACGEGVESIWLAKHGARIVGIDLVGGYKEKFLRRAKLSGVLNKVRFVRGDIFRMAFPSNSFDGCILVQPTKEFIEGFVLEEMVRVTKKGGTICIICAIPKVLFNLLLDQAKELRLRAMHRALGKVKIDNIFPLYNILLLRK